MIEGNQEFILPEEIPSESAYFEGAVQRILINRYERDPDARNACIGKYGSNCCICGFDFEAAYGAAGSGFIHVHHLKPLNEIGERYKVDPIKDLRPVCPNCHAMIHRKKIACSIDEMKALLKKPSS